jgi:NitT/TauT family transport system permease protein
VASTNLDTARVFALILYLSLLGLATFGLVVWLERKLVFWHRSSVHTAG